MKYQGIGIRAVAIFIDCIVFFFVFFLIGYIMTGSATFRLTGGPALIFMGIFFSFIFAYYIILEGTIGATIGKLICKIKVVKENGKPCGISASAIRNVFRIVDSIFFYLVGAILIARSKKCQRLGDRLAHTIVIKR